ncbi:MAG TPA: efflux RND transporter permease subunit [Candidatus Baltobacteraceae bacterium]
MRHEKSLIFLVAALTVLGVYSYVTIPASIFPTMTFARIDVVADVGDLPPDRVRIEVAQPLERAFDGLPSVTRTLATSAQGSAELIVEFVPSTDVQTDLQHVDQAIASARAALPAGATIEATAINPTTEPVLSYAFVAPTLSQTVVRELIQQSLIPQFYGTPGLARMLVVGGPAREYHVDLDPAALAAHGLTAADAGKAIADANAVISPGISSAYAQRQVLVIDNGISDAATLSSIVVSDAAHNPIPLRALGTVSLGVAPLTQQVSFDAHHANALNFFGLPQADAVKLADAVQQRMARLIPHLPSGISVHKYWDQTQLVRDSQKSLRDAILLGAFLAIVVIMLFLRNLRMTLVAALVIPVAMAVTIFTIGQFGQTLNLMSVGGLAVAVGLIIDDAIVVIENIARNLHLHPGESKQDVIARSMRELISPMTASSLTTVVVFVPLLLLTGVSGFFFRALAITLAIALLVSLGLAIFVTPIFADKLVGSASQTHDDVGFVARLLARYEPLLRWALNNRSKVYLGSAAVLLVTGLLLARLPSEFLPSLDEGQFEIVYRMPVGSTLAASDTAATALERIALSDPAVVDVGRFTGIDTNGFSPTPARQGTIRITLKPLRARDGFQTVSDRLRGAMQAAVPAVSLDFHQILEDMINDVSGAPAPIEVTLRGADQATLVAAAGDAAKRLKKVPGLTDVYSGVTYDDPTVKISPDAARMAALGLNSADFADALSAASQGTVATVLAEPSMVVPVRVSVRRPGDSAAAQFVVTPAGIVPISTVARTLPARLSSDVTEENGQRVVRLTANYGSRSLSAVVDDVRAALSAMPFPPGYTWSIGGEYQSQQQSFREFASVIAIAIALVFFVMLATFRSYRLPLVILTAIPLALIGVAIALFVTGTPFNVSSFMGLLLLVGLIVKNGILLIDVANRRRSEGASIEEALVAAGRARLRPIVMTTFAAIGGLLPLTFALGSGSEMEKPLAIAVIGGLSTATAFTLIAVPVLYAGFAGRERRA